MSIPDFAWVNLLLQYSVGFVGSLYLRRYFAWSLSVWSLFALLFLFNGFIVAHLAVGHFGFGGYFGLAFMVYFLAKISNATKPGQRDVLALAATLVFIYLQGAFHLYIWCVWFLLFLAVCQTQLWQSLAKAIAWSGFILAFRVLPTMWVFKQQNHFQFVGGFPTLSHLAESLTQIHPFGYTPVATYFGHLGWWELDMYIDLSGVLFLVLFGLLPQRVWAKLLAVYGAGKPNTNHLAARLGLPLLLFGLLSFSYIYGIVAKLPLPLLHSERVSSRFFVLVLVLGACIAATHCQNYLAALPSAKNRKAKIVIWLWALVLALSLLHHSFVWRINNIAPYYAQAPAPVVYKITHTNDLTYLFIAQASMAISVLGLLAWVWQLKSKEVFKQ